MSTTVMRRPPIETRRRVPCTAKARRPPSIMPAVAPATFLRKSLRLGIVFSRFAMP
jgi:hypothetical protein